MDVREKLVELVKNALAAYGSKTNEVLEPFEFIADFMMANGVTVQEWISVDDRLPDETGRYLAVKKELLRMSWVEAEQIL